jgi:predicted dehydrogenase
MLTIGVLGAGNTGKTHLRLIPGIGTYKLMGYYDPSGKGMDDEFPVYAFSSAEDLLEACDVIAITSPTLANYKIAEQALRKSKHVFIENSFSDNISQAKKLIQLARESGSKVHVGQNERFNPAFQAAKKYIGIPTLIEFRQHYTMNSISENISLVSDLLLHDLNIVLSLNNPNIRSVHAAGVCVLSDNPDIVNVRIEFDNGAVADLSVSRLAPVEKHSAVFYRRDASIEVDFRENIAQIIHRNNNQESLQEGNIKSLNNNTLTKIEVTPFDAVKLQLESFSEAIINNTRPLVSIDDGFNALPVVNKIIDQLRLNANFAASTIIA